MLNIEFLNEKATKVNTALKKVSNILNFGEETFLKTPMYPDRVKYYLIIIYDELEAISCHLLSNVHNGKIKENCLEKISQEGIFSEKLNRIFQDFAKFKKKLFEENFSYSDKELYHLSNQLVSTLQNFFLKELSQIVKQLKEKQPKLTIPVNLVKLNKHASVIKSQVKRLSPFRNMTEEEFINSPFAIDRSRYFMVVAIDSALWICRHIARQSGMKPDKNCFNSLKIDSDLADKLFQIVSLRDTLADPTKEVDKKFLYNLVKNYFEKIMDTYLKQISRLLFG